MQAVEAAILRTLLYADVFRFAMTSEEIHRHLISPEPVSFQTIEDTLTCSPNLKSALVQEGNYITLAHHVENIRYRQMRESYIDSMWDDAMRYGHWLSRIPFVRMVAMTGALAVRNPVDERDDYDYILVTQPGRVWLARAMAIVLVRIVRLRKRELCPNYVLASDQLQQKRQDLFIAREIAQMFPIYGGAIYEAMYTENNWVNSYLANVTPFPTRADKSYRLKSLLEKILGGWLGDVLEKWEYQRKRRKFDRQVKEAGSSAVINSGQVKGHFKDNGHPVMRAYRQRLQVYGLSHDATLELAGD